MFFVKIFLVVATICCTTQADMISNIPIIGGVLGTVTNASKSVINTAVDTVQQTGERIIESANYWESLIVNRLKGILKELQETLMHHPIPILGLPILEPYEHGHQDINITHEIGIFEGTMDDVLITGLSKFDIDNVSAKIKSKIPLLLMDPNITIDLHYKTLNIKGKYDIKAFIGDFLNVWGKGDFSLTMRGLKINANVAAIIDFKTQQIRIDDVSVDIKLENMTCNFENLMGGGDNGDLFNKVIGELAPEAVEVLWPEIRPGVEEKVKEIMVINLIPNKIRRLTDLFHINLNKITRIFGVEFS